MIGNSNSNISSTHLNEFVDRFGNANDSQELRSKGQDNIYVKNSSAKYFKSESSRINHQNNAKQEVKAMLMKSGLGAASADKMLSSVVGDRQQITVGDVKKVHQQFTKIEAEHNRLLENIKRDPDLLHQVLGGSSKVKVVNSRPSTDTATDIPKIWPRASKPGTYGLLIKNDNNGQIPTLTLDQVLEKFDGEIRDYAYLQMNLKNTKDSFQKNMPNNNSSHISNVKKEFENRMDSLQKQMTPTGQWHLAHDDERDRFTNIKTNFDTNINSKLNANQISVAGQIIGIATQFPKETQIGTQLREMLDRQAPALAVLTTDKEMVNERERMVPYFKDGYEDENIKATSSFVENKSLGKTKGPEGKMVKVQAKIYNMTIFDKTTNKYHQVPVMHVTSWPDMSPVNGKVMAKMGKQMNAWSNGDGNSFIHCRAGVGRTGQVLLGMAEQRVDKNVSLEEMLTDMRISRNGNMGQTKEQRAAMVDYFEANGRPVLYKEPESDYIYTLDDYDSDYIYG